MRPEPREDNPAKEQRRSAGVGHHNFPVKAPLMAASLGLERLIPLTLKHNPAHCIVMPPPCPERESAELTRGGVSNK